MKDTLYNEQAAEGYVNEEGLYIIPVRQPPFVRFFAHLFSYIFHPLFIPSYTALFLIFVHPYVFPDSNPKIKILRSISVVLMTAFFPAFSVFLLKQLGFVKSIFLKTRKERIIPYVISMFFYFWIFYVSLNLRDSPLLFKVMLLGVFLACIAAYMANIYYKVSMHAVAMGSFLTFFILLALQGNFFMGLYLSIATLITGAVCTARLVVSDHHPFDVYSGFLMGAIMQGVAMAVLMG
ncbi:MAG: phosphatase PAP2 family protein [Williamsia sp.]|nr:phosphatase PAP2 family protein [Williamsia sp.]